MGVWVIFQSHSWSDAGYHTEWLIHGIYNSEAKATEVITSLREEERNYIDSLSDWEKENEYDEVEFRMGKHSVL